METGAPTGRYFDVEINGENKRYFIQPKILSDATLSALRGVLIKRRRDKRRELMQDFGNLGSLLPKASQESFARELLADAKADVDISVSEVVSFLESMDREALATLLQCAVKEIKTFEEAVAVMEAYGDLDDLFDLIMGVAQEESEAVKN